MSQPIIVGHSPGDRSATAFAEELARVTGAPLSELDDSSPAALEHAIEAQQPALVVLGSGGGEATRVIHGAPCPVGVVPPGRARQAVRVVGAAFTPTPEGREALRAAAALARAFGARLRVVVALDPKHAEEAEGRLARVHHDHNAADDIALRHTMETEQEMQSAIADFAGGVEVETDELYQEPAHALIAASENLDLLVMGSRRRGPLKSVVLGSVSRHVAGSANCPVLVLPRGTEGAIEALVS
jgi:nucleotide-binding universal stress UspA family protein